MSRRLFSELHPVTYAISVQKMRFIRRVHNWVHRASFARQDHSQELPVLIYRHNSLIRRTLGNTATELQDNKAVSLGIAAPKVDRVVIRPGETFSFWRLLGTISRSKGYRDGVVISAGRAESGVGGGMCQFTNLIHWMVLHSPLTIVEHHHHGEFDLFPDFNRQIPFGTGTSIVQNYLDYRFRNDTEQSFQLLISVTEEYLRGELRADSALPLKYHVREKDAYFYRSAGKVYRHNKVTRTATDRRTGNQVLDELLLENDAVVCYDPALINSPILDERPYANLEFVEESRIR
ncbi:VanW family protein [Psychromicrobium lacuslunae]|uniref:Vancomycin resistance protein n=1 Tax=Psychromicrobium lacuslunae TaxID=1618207 RepID=A0A0D4BXB9_9MICC|nr:VanW family protein [Psychromicrobium lacuslunae]AJT40770.1 vancomycin resistance protein [Psychromicrobium lacuslunae]